MPAEPGRLLAAMIRGEPLTGPPLPDALGLALSEAAIHEGVVSLVRHSGLRTRLGDGGRAALEDAYALEQGRRLSILADLPAVTHALRNMPHAVVKGPVLSEVVYEQKGRRGFGDLDVLVNPLQFEEALDLLSEAGMPLLDRNWSLALEQRRGELAVRLPSGAPMDLHWSLVNEPAIRDNLGLHTGDLLERAQPAVINGSPALDPIDAAVHVMVHACLSGGHRLIWVSDIQQTLRHVALEDVLHRADQLGVLLPAWVAARRACQVLQLPCSQPRGVWAAVMALTARLLPPGRGPLQRPTAITPVAATRADTAASIKALIDRLAHPPHPYPPDELARPSSDAHRQQYLSYVAGS